jgi:hypothetical protein
MRIVVDAAAVERDKSPSTSATSTALTALQVCRSGSPPPKTGKPRHSKAS